MDTDNFHIRRGAEPFFMDGSDVGCVCIHGFTASPEEMRWLGEHLHAHGLTVYGPRLTGHGTDPAHMRRQHWLDWYEDALDGVALLRARCRKVFAVGLSMGGLLSLRVAAASVVDGAVVMAAPLYLDKPLVHFAPLIQYIKPYVTDAKPPNSLDDRVRAIQREMGREAYGRGAYGTTPTRAVGQLFALIGDVRDHLPAITVPLLLIYSKKDRTVPYGNMQLVAESVHSADLVTHTLERSDHVLPQDVERETVYDLVWGFLSTRLE